MVVFTGATVLGLRNLRGKPGATEPSQKWSYVKAVKADGIALVGAGFYPD